MATKPDPLFEALKSARQRSGANIGPAKPLSDEMKRRINEDMDKMGIGGKKTSDAGSDSDVATAKKGGSVKGWGIARGARKAKMY